MFHKTNCASRLPLGTPLRGEPDHPINPSDVHAKLESNDLEISEAEKLADTVPTESLEDRASKPTDHPEQVGPYKILDRIGQGGMGTVYVGEQRTPVRRRVALKVIKLGMDTKQVLARFEAEHHALAIMNHPNIARVYDAGATSEGRPYFAMEHVQGIPINDYCDRNRLTNEQRMNLFVQVCNGVQHAHQKGVIHRDLKPSNILVMMQEGKPVPKIIDFGVAKATAQPLTERTLYTELGQLLGTPEYMSPEQAEMTAIDIDTRSDVYSLGIILYELLVGALPFDPKTLRRAGYAEIQRIIREADPPRPSARLSTLEPGDSTAAAQHRRTDSRTLSRHLRGDLDWIILKALDKDRTRRYETANDLARDIQRHLADEPVEASPPSTAYRAKKFVRRNRGFVTALSSVLLVLVAGVVASTWFAVQATQARRLAETRLQEVERVKGEAEEERDRALFAEEQQRRERERAEVAQKKAQRAQRLVANFAGQRALRLTRELHGDDSPEVAKMLHTIAGGVLNRDYREPDDVSWAERLYRQALKIRRLRFGDEHAETILSLRELVGVLVAQGKPSDAERVAIQFFQGKDGESEVSAPNRAVIEILEDLYESRGKPDKTAEYRKMLSDHAPG